MAKIKLVLSERVRLLLNPLSLSFSLSVTLSSMYWHFSYMVGESNRESKENTERRGRNKKQSKSEERKSIIMCVSIIFITSYIYTNLT